jgi:hypothetical protein
VGFHVGGQGSGRCSSGKAQISLHFGGCHRPRFGGVQGSARYRQVALRQLAKLGLTDIESRIRFGRTIGEIGVKEEFSLFWFCLEREREWDQTSNRFILSHWKEL